MLFRSRERADRVGGPRERGILWVLLAAGVAVLLLVGRRDAPVLPGWVLCSARIPGHGVVELRESEHRRARLWLYHCRWVTPDGMARDYAVFDSSVRWRRVEFRWDATHKGVWLVVGGSHVAASLSVDTGRFVGENGLVMDPRVALGRQERAAMSGGQPGHPRWARPGRAVLLARCTR